MLHAFYYNKKIKIVTPKLYHDMETFSWHTCHILGKGIGCLQPEEIALGWITWHVP